MKKWGNVVLIWILWYHVSASGITKHTPLEKFDGADAETQCASLKQYVTKDMDAEYGVGRWGTLSCEELPVEVRGT